MRGFADRSLGPKENGDVVGGDKQAIMNVELLFPIMEQYGLRGVAFLTLVKPLDRPRASVGVSSGGPSEWACVGYLLLAHSEWSWDSRLTSNQAMTLPCSAFRRAIYRSRAHFRYFTCPNRS